MRHLHTIPADGILNGRRRSHQSMALTDKIVDASIKAETMAAQAAGGLMDAAGDLTGINMSKVRMRTAQHTENPVYLPHSNGEGVTPRDRSVVARCGGVQEGSGVAGFVRQQLDDATKWDAKTGGFAKHESKHNRQERLSQEKKKLKQKHEKQKHAKSSRTLKHAQSPSKHMELSTVDEEVAALEVRGSISMVCRSVRCTELTVCVCVCVCVFISAISLRRLECLTLRAAAMQAAPRCALLLGSHTSPAESTLG
jgi:hypothetical protein